MTRHQIRNPSEVAALHKQTYLKVRHPETNEIHRIPNSKIVPTRGSESRRGQRATFLLCQDFLDGHCGAGINCEFVHSNVDRASQITSTQSSHTNNKFASRNHEAMEAGLVLRVHDPNVRHIYHDFPSERILKTRGGMDYVASIQCGGKPRGLFHCAHFYLKKLCKLGCECTFIHALKPLGNTKRLASQSSTHPTHPDTDRQGELQINSVMQASPSTTTLPSCEDDAFLTSMENCDADSMNEVFIENSCATILYTMRHDPYSYDRCSVTISCASTPQSLNFTPVSSSIPPSIAPPVALTPCDPSPSGFDTCYYVPRSTPSPLALV